MNTVSPSKALFAVLALSACSAPAALPGGPHIGTQQLALGSGTFEEVSSFGSNPGALKMYRYTPSPAPTAGAGLVVAMHACTQNASQYRASGWEEVADSHGFYVLYPEQQSANNAAGCFNWAGEYGDPQNLTRGEGENQSIISMIDQMLADHGIDDSRIYVMGHSGGAAQTSLMMATWPDVFAGAGIIAGIPYHCTTTFSEVYSCLSPGKNKSPEVWGDLAASGFPGWSGAYPKVSIWHGTADPLVSFSNLNELVEQWTYANGIDMTPDVQDQLDGHSRKQYQDGSGKTLVESIEIVGAGHGTFVDPDSGCGSAGGYFLDENTCAALRMAESWGLIGGEGGSTSTSSSTGQAGATSNGSGAGGAASNGSTGSGAGDAQGGGATSGGNDASCTPGRQVYCSCADGFDGEQICNGDGTGYGECACDSPSCSLKRGARRKDPYRSTWPLMWAAGLIGLARARRGGRQ